MSFRVTAGRIARTHALAFAVAGAVASTMATAQAAQGEVTVDAQRHGDTVVVRASAIFDTDAATAWRVLTDYGRYRAFVPGLRASRVVAREGSHVIVEQTGVAPLWLLSLPMTITYDIVESPPTGLHSRAAVPGAGVLDSSYALAPAGGALRLDYLGTITIAPGPMTPLREGAAERAIVGHFRALVDEMERRSKHLRSRMASAPETGDGAMTR